MSEITITRQVPRVAFGNAASINATPPIPPDAKSGVIVITNAVDADVVFAAAGISSGGPTSIYGFQDASSPIADANGINPLEAIGEFTLRQQVLNWDRLAGRLISSAADTGFVKQHSTPTPPALPDPSTNSYLMIAFGRIVEAPTGDMGMMSILDAALYGGLDIQRRPIAGSAAGKAVTGGYPLPIGTVIAWAKSHNIARQCCKFYTPFEIIDTGFGEADVNTGETDYGVAIASGIPTANIEFISGLTLIGSCAELSDAQIGALLSTCNLDIEWAKPFARIDSPSGIRSPMVPVQWDGLRVPAPVDLWPLQENATVIYADIINDVPLLASEANSGVIIPGASIPGLNRFAIELIDGTPAQALVSGSAKLPDPNTVSVSMMLYVNVSAAAHGTVETLWSWLAGFGGAEFFSIFVKPTGEFGVAQNGNTLTSGVVNQLGVTQIVELVNDVTNLRTALYTMGEKILCPSYIPCTTHQGMYLGVTGTVVPACGAKIAIAGLEAGAAVEVSDDVRRARWRRLGWPTPAW